MIEVDTIIRRQNALLKRVKAILGNGTDDEILAVYREINRDRRMEEIEARKKEAKAEPATDKQRKYLLDLGVNPQGLSKATATAVISEKQKTHIQQQGKNG